MKFNSSIILSIYFLFLAVLSISSKNSFYKQYFVTTLSLSLFYFAKETIVLKANNFFKTLIRGLDFIGFLLLYQLMGIFTTYFSPFCDTTLIRFEEKLFGKQPLSFFDKISNAFFTEFFMICYFLYVPLLPIIFVYLVIKQIPHCDEYVLRLAITYSITFIFFFLFPIACPKYFINFETYKPLNGIILGNLIIDSWAKFDIKGGCFPSPHCAAGFTILYYLYKSKLTIFYPVLAIMIGMFISTVYGRFHYLTDSVIGILLSFIINVIIDRFTSKS